MKFYIPRIEETTLGNKMYEVFIENVEESDMDRIWQNVEGNGISVDCYEDNELVVSIAKDDWGFTKAEFIKEVKRLAKKK